MNVEVSAVVATSARPPVEHRQPAAIEMDEEQLKASVDGTLNRQPTVGLAVEVVQGGGLGFFHGHGAPNIESKTPITEDTLFRIASITKTFTAIAAMQLGEHGSVSEKARTL